jgi:hypothetical protein
VAELIDIDAAGGDVGCNQCTNRTVPEISKSTLTGVLAFISMNCRSAMTGFLKVLHHFVRTMFGPGKDQGIADRIIFQNVQEQLLLVSLCTKYRLCSIVSAVDDTGVTATCSGLRSIVVASCWISGGMVAENKSV